MMTSAQLWPQHPALPSARLFLAWLERARPGETLVYHRGLLADDRSTGSDLTETEHRAVVKVADAAFAAAEAGRVHPVQRRHGPFEFSYLAIKAARSTNRRGVPAAQTFRSEAA